MNVLALNSSPRANGRGKTELLLARLADGMRAAGANVEIVNLREKTIRPCVSCFTCWSRTPGLCAHNDDMTRELFPKWLAADLVVYATPLYHYTLTGTMKLFIERTLPVVEPFIVFRDGLSSHPTRQPTPAAVFLSVAAFPEPSVFEGLSAYVRLLQRLGVLPELLAEIYRPASGALDSPAFAASCRDILDAVTDAGAQLVRDRRVAPETLARIGQPIGDPQALATAANHFWNRAIARRLPLGDPPGEDVNRKS